MKNIVICWWSGGVTSAVACKAAINIYGKDSCRIIMIDTQNEHPDTYRFKDDCAKWYGKEIEIITGIGDKYSSIQDVWIKRKSLNVAHGAICSTELKRNVRERWQKDNDFTHQVIGFEIDKNEFNRAISMRLNNPKINPIFPLLMLGWNKSKCIEIVNDAGIEVPVTYKMGFHNNNCFKTGCVQGGIGYWQKMKLERHDAYLKMAEMEHKLTDIKGKPVTMLKDQSNDAKKSGNTLVFLEKHPDYPELKCLDDMPKCKVEPLFECNGFCGINDLSPKNETAYQINFEEDETT